ncbi:capsule biosynthesis protein [Mucilaginibacter limnophilus]|uniref:Capsule biosynthesis protein n=1 Tax=Mucilaginibacter limnophilus TaxID=1932778 RepID=A0A3S2VMP4_9SPHI|nr:SLBB domain-containing protein [Mucilaginibacter limnophilus]RVU00933.1 capsule biosynthesis protein [Mucilaginibacter limnophilus]
MIFLKKGFAFVVVVVCLLCVKPLLAQSVLSSPENINVSELSDNQIRAVMAQQQAAGVSDAQLIQGLITKGLPADQAKILQSRMNELRSGVSVNRRDTGTVQTARRLNYKPDTLNNPAANNITIGPQIFGKELFSNQSMSFEPNLKLATPVNYILGPDDQLNINIYGASVVNWSLNVSPEGTIAIPGVGNVSVAGRTIEQATSAIKTKLIANNYAIGRGSSLSVTLGNIRSIKVILVGEIVKPGTYTLPSLATVFNALYASGGPNDNGSFRQIEIIRNNKIIRKLDIYDFLLKGQQNDNIALRDQDIIRVPTYRTHVEITGEVKRPAIFEVLPGETLQTVLSFAGGFTDRAYTSRIKVLQVSDQQRRITDVFEGDFDNYIPLRGDKYIVQRILERYENRVTILGAVFRPGEYELEKGLTLSRLIQKAAGLKEDAFTGRGSITRLKPDNTNELISFNIQDIVSKKAPDILLQREDTVKISSLFDLRNKYFVTIKGKVRNAGDFAYADSMSVTDLIIKAGGFEEGASSKRVEIARRVNNADPNSTSSNIAQVFTVNVDPQLKADVDLKLRPYDIVSVYSLPGYETQKTIRIEGEVVYPGYYTIQRKDEKISDLLKRAGGLTASADAEGASLKRTNQLGVDKQKVDSAQLNRERLERLNRVSGVYSDTTSYLDARSRNEFVGIDLQKILEKPGSKTDLLLEDGDIIRIPKQQQVVRVNGEVLYPSAVVYTKGDSFRNYVINSGGYSPDADSRHAYIVYPNGQVKGTKKFLFFNDHPTVKPGSEIYVPRKSNEKKVTVQEIAGLSTSFASLALLIMYIIRN